MSTDPLADLLVTRDSSLPLAAAALARVADDQGRAPFDAVAVAYREAFLKLRVHARGTAVSDGGALSVDEARANLASSVLPRLAGMRVVVVPPGALWHDAPVAFTGPVWQTLVAQPDRAVARLFDAAERTFAAPDWDKQVFAKTRLEKVFLTNEFDDPLEGFDTSRYVPCLRTDTLVFHLAKPDTRQRLAKAQPSPASNAGPVSM